MSNAKGSRGTMLAIAFTLATAWTAACFDEEKELGGAPCLTDADCWNTQECQQTPTQSALGIGGACQAKGSGCAVREQNGCGCSIDPGESACSSTESLRASNEDERDNCLCCDCSGISGAVVNVIDNGNGDECLCCPPNRNMNTADPLEVFVGVDEDNECKYCPDSCTIGDPNIECECPDDAGTSG